ncbi:helix-turn-helix domain-containing protein [Mesorhizobium sp. KR9-304]|uniref:helix-turn-helix domain-containing protein n=1 Tax=Mesorhizobium sp. KR9-304 TaxID=3156614 RepID=UPI0032B3121A
MSSSALKWARRQLVPNGALKAVLTEIASVSRDGINAWPSQHTIAQSTGLSQRTVWQSLQILQQLGLIDRRRRSLGRNGRTSDMISLAVHREFRLTRAAILDARQGLKWLRRKGSMDALQLANSASATRNRCERIKRDKHLPIQKEEKPTYDGLAQARPAITLVVGASANREDAA